MADQPSRMKMTTQVPPGIAAPDEVETRLGTLRYTDGVPDESTSRKIFEQLDFQRGVEAMLMTLNGALMWAFRRALRTFGPDNQTAIIWEQRMALPAPTRDKAATTCCCLQATTVTCPMGITSCAPRRSATGSWRAASW